MLSNNESTSLNAADVDNKARGDRTSRPSVDSNCANVIALNVVKEVAPLWTLERFVAINPLLGYTGGPLMKLAKNSGAWLSAKLYPPSEYFRSLHQEGRLTGDDILYASSTPLSSLDAGIVPTVANLLREEQVEAAQLDRSVDSAIRANAAKWFASLLDDTRAGWQPTSGAGTFFEHWQALASADLSLDIAGFGAIRREIKRLQKSPEANIGAFIAFNGLTQDESAFEMRRLAKRNFGWLSYARFLDREGAQEDGAASLAYQILAIQAAYELAMAKSGIQSRPGLRTSDRVLAGEVRDVFGAKDMLLNAAERSARKSLVRWFSTEVFRRTPAARPRFQAVFCIDARSEVLRRSLECLSSEVATVGFAGFFGLTIACQSKFGGLSSRCPVLLAPTFEARLDGEASRSTFAAGAMGAAKALLTTTFSYAEAFGLTYLPILVRKLFAPIQPTDQRLFSHVTMTLNETSRTRDLPTRVATAKSILKHAGLSNNLGKTVLFCGHGSSSENNPHASGLDCGACGGHRGDINAIAAASLLNDQAVRRELNGSGFNIAEDVFFVAGLHNTTTGLVTLFDSPLIPESHVAEVAELKKLLVMAGSHANSERADIEGRVSRGKASGHEAARRGADIGEVRPEWGLANNAFFIAARRELTRDLSLAGRAFLHDYDPKKDDDEATLELILTAPLVVAHWINMQYYASTVDPDNFGSGSKLVQSAVGSFGVIEGTSNELRLGLPLQSLHDGARFVHEPIRLQVFVEAAPDAIDRVLLKHKDIADLVSNGWITLICIVAGQDCKLALRRCFGPGCWVVEPCPISEG